MGKKKSQPRYMDEATGVYRCPKCGHKWEQRLDRDAACPKCQEIQGPVVVK